MGGDVRVARSRASKRRKPDAYPAFNSSLVTWRTRARSLVPDRAGTFIFSLFSFDEVLKEKHPSLPEPRAPSRPSTRERLDYALMSASMSAVSAAFSSLGENRFAGTPSFPMRNFSKFHVTSERRTGDHWIGIEFGCVW